MKHSLFVCLQLRSAGSSSTKVFVIDEIGKMELFSQSFVRAVSQTLDSPCVILGTIPVPKGRPLGLVEEVRSRRDVKVFHVSKNLFTWETRLGHYRTMFALCLAFERQKGHDPTLSLSL